MSSSQSLNDDQQESVAVVDEIIIIPDHLMELIFLHLPVKTLIRFHSLSKQWEAKIISPSFTSPHTTTMIKQNTSACTVVYVDSSRKVFEVYTDRISTTPDHPPTFNRLIRRIYRRRGWPSHVALVHYGCEYSSCNGLICTAWFKFDHTCSFVTSLMRVWNPATGKVRKLVSMPPDSSVKTSTSTILTGFGYDSTIDDYKIVYVSALTGHLDSVSRRVQFMSLKSNTWRSIDPSLSPDLADVYCKCSQFSWPVAVRGAVYWIVKGRPLSHADGPFGVQILKCDLAQERFVTLPFPPCENIYALMMSRLSSHDESLFLFIPAADECSEEYTIWIMQMEQQDGNAIWRRAGSIPPLMSIRMVDVLGFNCSGHVILRAMIKEGLLAFIPSENRFVELGSCPSPTGNVHLVQMETLLSP